MTALGPLRNVERHHYLRPLKSLIHPWQILFKYHSVSVQVTPKAPWRSPSRAATIISSTLHLPDVGERKWRPCSDVMRTYDPPSLPTSDNRQRQPDETIRLSAFKPGAPRFSTLQPLLQVARYIANLSFPNDTVSFCFVLLQLSRTKVFRFCQPSDVRLIMYPVQSVCLCVCV